MCGKGLQRPYGAREPLWAFLPLVTLFGVVGCTVGALAEDVQRDGDPCRVTLRTDGGFIFHDYLEHQSVALRHQQKKSRAAEGMPMRMMGRAKRMIVSMPLL